MFHIHTSYGQRSYTLALAGALAVFVMEVAVEDAIWIKLDLLIAGAVRLVTVVLLLFGG